jgi:hypothetical protein
MAENPEFEHPVEIKDGSEGEKKLVARRDFLVGLRKWSAIVIGGVLVGAALPSQARAAWINGGRAWVNGRGGWINGHRGSAGWINRSGGSGAWFNRGVAWANRGVTWANRGGWYNRSGTWTNGVRGGWVNNRGGAGWINRH